MFDREAVSLFRRRSDFSNGYFINRLEIFKKAEEVLIILSLP